MCMQGLGKEDTASAAVQNVHADIASAWYSYDKIIMPASSSDHWFVVVVDQHRRRFHVYDAVGGEGQGEGGQGRLDEELDAVAAFLDVLRPEVPLDWEEARPARDHGKWMKNYKTYPQRANQYGSGLHAIAIVARLVHLGQMARPEDFEYEAWSPEAMLCLRSSLIGMMRSKLPVSDNDVLAEFSRCLPE